jgi:hypothetical protein
MTDMLHKTKEIYLRWKNSDLNSQDAFQLITGETYAEDTARKYLNGLGVWLRSTPTSRLDGMKIETTMEKQQNKNGETIYVQTSNMLTTIANLENKTPSELLALHGYDILQWELISCSNKAWNGTSKMQGTYTMYSSSIKVKPIQSFLTKDSIIEVFENLSPPKHNPIVYKGGNKLLEFPIMDIHLGKLAWDKETGFDYDLDVAEKRYVGAIMDIISKVKAYGFEIEKILFPIGQDFFNVDNDKGSTNKGTPQSIDSRWQKMYKRGCDMVIWAVEELKQIAPVEICYVKANHDSMLSYFLVLNTSAWFRNCGEVSINISPTPRKYYQYGKCMIGYSHGEEAKTQLDKLMAAESPKIWGDTVYRELHLGHLHTERVYEYAGLIIRRISSVTSADSWHTDSGYIGTVMKAQAFIWDKETGLETIINSTVKGD